ncbi:nuclear transport factor 2 family protein [Clostridium sp. BL-8]|uniref:nuclear transport factor 2 family protein n=1 Tax=Clostridium sp. BL-8 TaxID=349938 RepID=UPI00098CBB37|nr:nuclear transport factor 2 family protein [Clostridium sp. BL-8]OOM81111.1 hypothetical protein CLOBL_04010 [Clostridium sp. BL-8]
MNKQALPKIIESYIDASNKHDVEAYVNTFSDSCEIQEKSIGSNLIGKNEVRNYFSTYFVGYETYTEIIEYYVKENFVDMRVLFKGNFPENEITGLYQFFIEEGKIVKLVADLE